MNISIILIEAILGICPSTTQIAAIHTTKSIRPPMLHLKEFYFCEPSEERPVYIANALEHDATNEEHNEKNKYFFENAHFLPPNI